VDARDRLRQYLEQRKELGENDLVLDEMSVDELMGLLGGPNAARTGAGSARADAERVGPPQATPAPRRQPPQPAPRPPAQRLPDPPPPPPRAAATPGQPVQVGSGSVSDAASATFAGKLGSLDAIASAVAACQLCGLHKTAKHPVPGEGNPEAKFVCVGEAPGATEDETGRPFVGQAGQLLTKILEAINFKREDVFICNVLKHRPPGNRNPEPHEIAVCSPYLLQQLSLLQPRVILALGTFAAQTLLQTSSPIGKLRGQIHRFYGVPLIVTYHPAALLRNPNWKRPTWEDVQLARRIFDNPTGTA
jgi:DNA polymerase